MDHLVPAARNRMRLPPVVELAIEQKEYSGPLNPLFAAHLNHPTN
jgi:hypothetical protein